MKKQFLLLVSCLMFAFNAMAVGVSEVSGKFKGTLTIEDLDQQGEVLIIPGVESNTISLVLPDFEFNSLPLGNIVVLNVPMANDGKISLDKYPVYIKVLETRAFVNINTGSKLTADKVLLSLTINVPVLNQDMSVSFVGNRLSGNYQMPNAGFETGWKSVGKGTEPEGWHGFNSGTGTLISAAQNADQLQESSDVRPGSKGTKSALIQSKKLFNVRANGPLTNGQMNAASITAGEASKNYAFSDPDNAGFNTPFKAQPDSFVFWAKYVPGGGTVTDPSNTARMHAVITTNARYQDPETADYSKVKVAEAESDFQATSSKGWQRISVPFVYSTKVSTDDAAYIMITFTTNKTAGGGKSDDTPDKLYLDDIELVYNASLKSFTLENEAIVFSNGKATTDKEFSDENYELNAIVEGRTAKAFVGFDSKNHRILIYVVSDNFVANSSDYKVYEVEMAQTATGFQTIEAESVKTKKVMLNGQVYISRGGQFFNLLGQPVKL
ncbi:MAG: hypothetical protein IJS73_06545 [Paludibacteraceae bacterium]|nr:hypothetical protein [Paludibacteraceae bacterium]